MSVWVFVGEAAKFPAGVFAERDTAAQWIAKHRLTGTLTLYPMDTGVYEWAIERGYFKPKRPDQEEPPFIGRFSSASQEHYHYRDGMHA